MKAWRSVRANRLSEPGPAGDTSYDPAGAVTIEAVAADRDEDRAAGTFADGQVDGTGRCAERGWKCQVEMAPL